MLSQVAHQIDPRWVRATKRPIHLSARWMVLKSGDRIWATRPVLSAGGYEDCPGPVAMWLLDDSLVYPTSDVTRDLESYRGSQIVVIDGTATLLPGGRITQRPSRIPAPGEWCPWLRQAVDRADCVWSPGMPMVAAADRRSIETRSGQMVLWLD